MYTPIYMDVSSGLLESDSEITVGGRDRGTGVGFLVGNL